jgi:hypothetical protein
MRNSKYERCQYFTTFCKYYITNWLEPCRDLFYTLCIPVSIRPYICRAYPLIFFLQVNPFFMDPDPTRPTVIGKISTNFGYITVLTKKASNKSNKIYC